MEQAQDRSVSTKVETGSSVIVGLRAGDAAELADILLAAELAAKTGSRLVVIAERDRWARFARWTSGMYCAFGMDGVAQASHTAERAVQDDLYERVAGVVSLVPVEWSLVWAAGSASRAAVRYARRNPTLLVMFRPPTGR
ncbi:hypothetical protein I6A84_38245 [Frankia sp. CNm7]|uniref:Uncharacterized protein n=1 Tax=Frankia nepalensis TaxID=1836974 RepID=A0A937RHZ2_9ACTN|nr:hypothetical protein [Frankia nepalensis]MBL7497716.1 hypothetical protein [Frankia nepalensis]MBL7514175.1 hypothetical protein [Frankia nepalensis]MBL7523728.1 hypothetical protein [Frankia nepalensis]MBL7629179.1 hypothetical protein [Frankia nepalensis]